MSDRKALNVGINQFRDCPEFTLRGCINDVRNFSKVFIDYLGFSEGDMVELVDERATKANMINTLKSIVADATQGKYSCIFLKLSMHGTQIPNKTGTEVDHMDEAFVLYDVAQIGDNWDREHIIVDDELAEILSALPSNVLFEGFADTCHSGTEIRMIELFRTTTLVREKAPPIINRYVEQFADLKVILLLF
jgi:metacaspase-1